MPNPHETIRIAHTARCKLHMAANAPDRNFRFILGHALTLDKMMLRIAEIETDSSDDDEEGVAEAEPHGPTTATSTRERRVSFSSTSRARHDVAVEAKEHDRKQRRSPPPARLPHPGEDDDDDDDDDDAVEDDEEEADGALSLQRFPSASAQPPRLVADDGDEGYDDPDSPVTPTDEDLRGAMAGKSNEELTQVYQHLVGCPCHGQTAPAVSGVWEMPQKEGVHGPRMAVVQVAA